MSRWVRQDPPSTPGPRRDPRAPHSTTRRLGRVLVVGIVLAGVAALVQCTAEESPGAGLTPSTQRRTVRRAPSHRLLTHQGRSNCLQKPVAVSKTPGANVGSRSSSVINLRLKPKFQSTLVDQS